MRICETPRKALSGAVAVYAAGVRREVPDAYTVTPGLMSFAAPGAVLMGTTVEQAANLLPVEQAALRILVRGEWEV